MRTRNTGKERSMAARQTARRGAVVAIALVLSMAGTGLMLGQHTGAFSQSSHRSAPAQPDAAITPASFDPASPSKEYIYAGGKLIATEEPQSGGSGPGSTTPGLYNPNTTPGGFFLRNSNSTGVADISFNYAAGAGWIPISGDWNGDGIDTVGFYDQAGGIFYLKNSNSAGPADSDGSRSSEIGMVCSACLVNEGRPQVRSRL